MTVADDFIYQQLVAELLTDPEKLSAEITAGLALLDGRHELTDGGTAVDSISVVITEADEPPPTVAIKAVKPPADTSPI